MAEVIAPEPDLAVFEIPVTTALVQENVAPKVRLVGV